MLDHVQRGEALNAGAHELEQLRQRIKQLRVAQQIESAAGGRGPHAPRAPGELDDRAVSSLLMSLMAPEQLSPSAYGGAGSGPSDAGAAGAAGTGKGSPAAAGSAKKRKSLAGADADGAPKKRKAAGAPEAGGSGGKPKAKRAKQDAAAEEKGTYAHPAGPGSASAPAETVRMLKK